MPGRHKIRQLAVNSPEGRDRMKRARAAVQAIRAGADPHLTLSYVIWPSRRVQCGDERKAA